MSVCGRLGRTTPILHCMCAMSDCAYSHMPRLVCVVCWQCQTVLTHTCLDWIANRKAMRLTSDCATKLFATLAPPICHNALKQNLHNPIQRLPERPPETMFGETLRRLHDGVQIIRGILLDLADPVSSSSTCNCLF